MSHRRLPPRTSSLLGIALLLIVVGCSAEDAAPASTAAAPTATETAGSPTDTAQPAEAATTPAEATPTPAEVDETEEPPAVSLEPVPGPTPVPADVDPVEAYRRLVGQELPALDANPDPEALIEYYSPELEAFDTIQAFHTEMVQNDRTARYEQPPELVSAEVVEERADGSVVLEAKLDIPVLNVYDPDGHAVISSQAEVREHRVVLEPSSGNWRVAAIELTADASPPPT